METSRNNRKKWIIRTAALAAAAVLLVLALLLLAGRQGLSARFDDPREILAEYDESAFPALSLEADGTASVRLTRNDLYSYASRAGLLDTLTEALSQRGCSDAGVRISDGVFSVYARCRSLRLLRLTYKAQLGVTWQAGQLVFTPEKVWLGSALVLPESRWPELFSRPLAVDPGEVGRSILDAAVRGEALEIRLAGLNEAFTGRLEADRGMLCAAAICGVPVTDDEGAAALLSSAPEGLIPMDAAEGLLRQSENVPETLFSLLSGCTAESLETLWPELEANYRAALLAQARSGAAQRREALDAALAAEQSRYEKLLSAVREAYKGGALAIGETGFVSASTGEPITAGSLTALSATDTDSRIVFLYTLRGSREICLSDMPPLSEVPRAGKKVDETRLRLADAYDLGVVLTSEGNVPLLLHRHREGSFILRVLSDADYVSALVERSIPVLCVDDLPPSATRYRRSAGEGWNDALILLLK